MQLEEDLAHPVALDRHPGQADDVVLLEGLEVDVLDVLVDERDFVLAGREAREDRSARTGMFDFLPRIGRPWFNPQNEVGNRGLIRQILAMNEPSKDIVSSGRRIALS